MRKLNRLVKNSEEIEKFGVAQPRDLIVLQHVAQNPNGVPLTEISKLIATDANKKVTPGSALAVLNRLKDDLGFVEKVGSYATARWILTKKGREAIK